MCYSVAWGRIGLPQTAPDAVILQTTSGGKKMKYRKLKGSDTWHWCRNCSNWPTSNYVERDAKPTSGELDNECLAKEKAGTCKRT